MGHYSSRKSVATSLEHPTRQLELAVLKHWPIWACTTQSLPDFTTAHTLEHVVHTFCCTCPHLTVDGRYPLRCHAVSGPSSRANAPAMAWPFFLDSINATYWNYSQSILSVIQTLYGIKPLKINIFNWLSNPRRFCSVKYKVLSFLSPYLFIFSMFYPKLWKTIRPILWTIYWSNKSKVAFRCLKI